MINGLRLEIGFYPAWNSCLDLHGTFDATEILHYILFYALIVDKK